MKKFVLIAVLLLGMSAMACGQSGGTLTLTGIPSQFNGKFVFLAGDLPNEELFGCTSINVETEEAILPRISNGRVSIPLWIINERTNSVSRYTGNHTADFLEIMICNSPKFDGDAIAEIEFEDVVFRNGSATISWNEGEFWD